MSLLSSGAVTVADYRVVTGDESTDASAVSAALLEGQSLLEDHLRRHLDSAQRTDSFVIYPDARIYPDAYPITAVPANSGVTIDGRSLMGAVPDAGPFIGVIDVRVPLRATVTWTGGYTNASGAAPLPRTLAHALYALARGLVTDTSTTGGFVRASLGDVSVDYGSASDADLDAIAPGVSRRVRKYRNRWLAAGSPQRILGDRTWSQVGSP